ncbi:hypothetical protein ACIPW9_36360 [Streptomyces sp. NPDC090052]|uniref:hypothetical protein n=1 Tax=Streptomyces sp. NPDC090052 TaxID=3365931 RepID=UPI0038294B2C
MDQDRGPAQHSDDAAEAVRQLNHATLSTSAYPYPGEASKTVLGFIDMLNRLPQSLDQLAAGLRALEGRGGIVMDDGSEVSEQVSIVLRSLLNAKEALSTARGALQEASTPLFHMGGVLADGDDAV